MATKRTHARSVERQRGAKQDRLQARISSTQRELLQRAADLEGRTLSDFVVDSAQRRAEEVIREHEIIRLSPRDSRAFVESLLNPPAPSARMRALAARYQREVEER